MARARILVDAETEIVLSRIAAGVPVLTALDEVGADWGDWQATCKGRPALIDEWGNARAMATHLIPDRMMAIAENEPDVKRAKLRLDTLKWLASSHNKSLYGNIVKVEQTIDVSVRLALANGRERVKELSPLDVIPTIPGTQAHAVLASGNVENMLTSSVINTLASDCISDAMPPTPIPSLFD